MSILVKGGLLITQDDSRRIIEGNLYVEKGKIAEIGGPERSADVVMDARGCVVLPGLINCYTKAAHVLLGPPRDVSLEAIGKRMEDLEAQLTRRDLQMAAALASAEMALGGTTTFLDLFTWEEEVARGVTQVGLRGCLAWRVKVPEDLKLAEQFLVRSEMWKRVTPLVGSPGMADVGLLEEARALAEKHGRRWCLPLSESRRDVYQLQRAKGMRPAEWLEKRNLLSRDMIALHCVWLTMNEIKTLARAEVNAVHCPASNQMTGVGGPAPLLEMLQEGMTLGLGTDSPCLGGTFDLIHHMRLCALLQKGHRWDSTAVPAQLALDLCTVRAAKVLGLGVGSLQEGNAADFVVLDPATAFTPEEVLSYLVYLAEGAQVRDVVVDGKVVVDNRILKGLDVSSLREDVSKMREELGHEESGH